MRNSGPVIVIDDDREDQQILHEIFLTLDPNRKVIFFNDGQDALDYLNATTDRPFLILSDINMPKMNGFQVRDEIRRTEKLRWIPYLFFSTGVDQKAVNHAYDMSVQGFFLKPGSMRKMQETVKKIIDYWDECYAPGHFF